MNNFYGKSLSSYFNRFKRNFPDDYPIVESFATDLIANGISEDRVISYVTRLSAIRKVVKKNLKELTKEDVKKVINHYQLLCNRGKISDSYIFEIKTLKKFFKWMGKGELVNWFTLGKVETKISPSDLITEEEFRKMLDACYNSRDKALISLLYETGARIGEVGSMRIKDVIFDEYGAIVWLPMSKTQKRKLRVVFSVQYLSAWLSDHPLRMIQGSSEDTLFDRREYQPRRSVWYYL